MKTKQNLFIGLIVVAMMQPILSKAQNLSFKEPHVKKVGWQASKIDDAGSNVKNGVEFYDQKGDCPYGIILLFKVVNTNNYAVKISYQLADFSPVVNVLVPASSTLESSCSDTEGNLSKLVIKMPEKEDAKEKMKQYLRSHLVVSQNN